MAVACEQFVPCTEKEVPTGTPIRSNPEKQGASFSQKFRGVKGILRDQHSDVASKNPGKSVTWKDVSYPNETHPSRSTPPSATAAEKRLPPLCLNTKTCPNERHYVRYCPKSTPAEKKLLLEEYLRNKPKTSGAVKQLTLSDDTTADETPSSTARSDGRIQALLADTALVVVKGNYGSDHAALSEAHLNQLAKENVFVSVLPLSSPIAMDLAVKGSDDPITVTAERKARISTTLRTMEGPFKLRNVEYLVFKEDMDEVLLSRPLLQSLGFNLDEHLSRVRSQYHDVDCSHISFDADPGLADTVDEHEGALSQLMTQEPKAHAEYLDETDDESPVLPKTTDDSSSVIEDNIIDVGDHTSPGVAPHLQRMLQDAIDHGLPSTRVPRLRQMLAKYADIFRVKIGSDPPVDIPPMNIRLQPNAEPVRVKLRRYALPQAAFLRHKVDDLERLGLVRRNNESSWACEPLIVPKPGPEQFRFTTDLRPVNKLTLPHAWPMPDLETVLSRLANKRCFASIDLCHGYWQLPLAEDSQECQSFITPDGVYTPTRVMHGQRNAVAYCQSSVQLICQSILDKLLPWLGDILFHAEDATEHLDTLEEFFALCEKYGLKLHAAKCKLFLEEVKWCGRIISSEGVRMDPSRLEALLAMPFPTMGDELQQFACAANWMRAGIPQFTTVMSPLVGLLEQVYTKAGGRTKRLAAKIKLADVGWSQEHAISFTNAK